MHERRALRSLGILALTLSPALFGACRRDKAPAPTAAHAASNTPTAQALRVTAANTPAAQAFYADHFSRRATVNEMTALGRQLFFDATLSASGKMACATCHDPKFAFGPPTERSTALGGPDLKSPGLRAVPSLRYAQTVPAFEEHHFDEAVEDSTDQGPTGGHGWDGRADTKHDQARLPLTSPFEMANDSVESVVQKVAKGALAAGFRAAFGDDVFSDPKHGAIAVLKCLEVFQQSPKDFYPYNSRYDAYLRNRGDLTAAELHGLALFNDPKKGNCASCHPSQVRKGSFPNFTDFGFNAIAVPRNREIAANSDPNYHDLGLCGPLRTDLENHKEYCGMFRVPSLRNVGLRRAFFHNGVLHSLDRVVAFYAERDSNPGEWYQKVNGRTDAYDDLPVEYRNNVNHERPFGGKPGSRPALDAAEIRDVVAFLNTLTDADLLLH